MSVTQVDLDDEALAEAMRLMGASTKKETVNGALRDYVAHQAAGGCREAGRAGRAGASSRPRSMQLPSALGGQPSSDHVPSRPVRPVASLPYAGCVAVMGRAHRCWRVPHLRAHEGGVPLLGYKPGSPGRVGRRAG